MKQAILILFAFILPFFCSAAIGPITGAASVCMGQTDTLSDTTIGGVWSSGATGVATIGSSTGVVTGISTGNATITYTAGGGYATMTVTVMAIVVPRVSAVETHPYTGYTGVPDTFIAVPVNGGSAPQYQWYVNGVPLAGHASDTLIFASLQCSDSLSIHMASNASCAVPFFVDSLVALCTSTSIPTVFAIGYASIYPNPAQNELMIENAEGSEIKIFNLPGQEELSVKNISNKEVVNIQKLTPGIYIIQVIEANGEQRNYRVVKE